MSQAFKFTMIGIFAVIIIYGGIYLWQNSQSPPTPEATEEFSIISIMVPEDYDSYRQKVAEHVQVGGPDPLIDTKFVKKTLTIPFTEDRILASAQAAADEMPLGGGPETATVSYLKVENGTAYVQTDINQDGWAGISVSIAAIGPVIEQTLLQFPEINEVVFGYAPEDEPG